MKLSFAKSRRTAKGLWTETGTGIIGNFQHTNFCKAKPKKAVSLTVESR